LKNLVLSCLGLSVIGLASLVSLAVGDTSTAFDRAYAEPPAPIVSPEKTEAQLDVELYVLGISLGDDSISLPENLARPGTWCSIPVLTVNPPITGDNYDSKCYLAYKAEVEATQQRYNACVTASCPKRWFGTPGAGVWLYSCDCVHGSCGTVANSELDAAEAAYAECFAGN